MQKMNKLLCKAIVVVLMLLMTISSPQKGLALANTQRLAGGDRYDTAVEISKSGWQQSDFAILATGENFPDALCAAPLAKKYSSPVILSPKGALTQKAVDELKRLKVRQVFIIGGTGVISENVVNQVTALGINCVRVYGADRYDTSVEVAKYLGTGTEIVIATGNDFPDALSIASIAASKGMPIVLTDKDSIPKNVKQYIYSRNITRSYVIGGPGAIGESVFNELPNPQRIAGSDRYQTNIEVLNKFLPFVDFNTTYVATGLDFPDALAGSALAPRSSSPIVLTDRLPYKPVRDFMKSKLSAIGKIGVLGGEGAVTGDVISNILYDNAVTNNVTANPSTVSSIPSYSLKGSGKYQYTGTLTMKNNGTSQIQDIYLEIDLGRLNDSPYQKDETVKAEGPGISITTDKNGDKKAIVKLSSLGAGQSVEYKFIRKFTNAGIKYNADFSEASGDYSSFGSYKTYTSPEDKIESGDPAIKSKATQITKGMTNPYLKAKKIYEFVNTSIAYDFSEGNKGALNALTTGKGVCEDFAGLFTAMARSAGIPSRVVYGFWMESLNFTELEDISTYRHAWAEFYIPGSGWVVAEPTVIKTNSSGDRVAAMEYFGGLSEPGHFVRGYKNESFYSIKYYIEEDAQPKIDITTKEYISKQ